MSKFINFYKTANGELIIPNKTLLRNSDINIMSNAKFKKASDFSIVNNPAIITDFSNGFLLPGMPDAALWSVRGAEAAAIWNYNETKQNIENSVNSFVDFYKNYNK